MAVQQQPNDTSLSLPRVGMLAIVRNRRGIISEVRDFDSREGVYHIVGVDYKDDLHPYYEELLWESEPNRKLLLPGALPKASDHPMPNNDFDALIRAARWSAISPYLDPDGDGPLERLPAAAPFFGALKVDDYQLIPLLKALRMPRVNLMIADDVGLGKTIEAGLIIRELLLRRRVNRIMIITPASLRVQWQNEMMDKFSLPFDIIDKNSTMKLRRSLGIDANPWRSRSRIITSYHYLKQPDILEQFLATCQPSDTSSHLPWDLLVVDEAHNFLPSVFGEDSQLTKALRQIAPQFEHRLFLTATPHNGYTQSFTGLLEILDPVRFTKKDTLDAADKARIPQLVIRRLKRELNERITPPPFCKRMPPQALLLDIKPVELKLITAFEVFRNKLRKMVLGAARGRRTAAYFAIEILGKRLLSGPMTFLESWQRIKLGLSDDVTADDQSVIIASNSLKEELDDDLESKEREIAAAAVIGSWMRGFAAELSSEIHEIDLAAKNMGIDLDRYILSQTPKADARWDALQSLLKDLIVKENVWSDDERIIIFTEYKTTLDYLLQHLRKTYPKDEQRILTLYGGMDDAERERIKSEFNDPESPVRILIATDAASEGLNLQLTARYMLHFDIPWNPSRLEQRNGRLDRHSQPRDVFIHHFASEQVADLKFMAYILRKVDQIREDLGAVSDLFDEATQRLLIDGEDLSLIQSILESRLDSAKKSVSFSADSNSGLDTLAVTQRFKALSEELDISPEAGISVLETAIAAGNGRPQLSPIDHEHSSKILNPALPGWKDTIDDTLRISNHQRLNGVLPKITFNPNVFLKSVGSRFVFQPRLDIRLLHLGHPMIQRALGVLNRKRYPGTESVSRWTVRYGDVPQDADALLILHLEEMGVNDLRETFHHWINTIAIPVLDGELQNPLPHKPAASYQAASDHPSSHIQEKAADLLELLDLDILDVMKAHKQKLNAQLRGQLILDYKSARDAETQSFDSRQGELSSLINTNCMFR
jgi:ERCC4-related helicase